MNVVNDFLTKTLGKFIGNVTTAALESVVTTFNTLFQSLMKSFVEQSAVTSIHNAFVGLSIFLITLFCMISYFNTYVAETDGDPDADPLDIIVRGAKAVAYSSCSAWLFGTFMNFTSALAEMAITALGANEDWSSSLVDVISALMMNFTSKGFVWLLVILALVIGMIAFYVIATIRAIELMLMYIVLPLFCAELCYTSHERLNGIVTSICVTGLYYILQLICFYMLCRSIVAMLTGVSPDNAVTLEGFRSLGWLIATLRSPKWLEKFAYSTGVGEGSKRAIGTVGTSAMHGVFNKLLR